MIIKPPSKRRRKKNRKNTATEVYSIIVKDISKLLKALSETTDEIVYIDGFRVKNRQRYGFFYRSGAFCRCCGNHAFIAKLERDKNASFNLFHLVFYIKRGKREVPLTIDHIIPKAKDGKNEEENFQVLCEECNRKKGDTIVKY